MIYGFTAIFEPIANEFGWSYAEVSFAASIRGLETSFIAPVVGFLIDRFGARKLIFAGALITGAGLLFSSRINSLVSLYLVFALITFGTATCGGVVLSTIAGQWFRKRLGLALSIVVSGSSFGGLMVPLVSYIVDLYGWRWAMVAFGIGTWILVLPLSLLVRHKPEQYGLLPDGDTVPPQSLPNSRLPGPSEPKIGYRQFLKSRPFWHIALAFAFHVFGTSGVIIHVMPYLSSLSIPRTTASFVASAIPFATIFGRMSFGWLGDRYGKKQITAAGYLATIVGLLMFAYVSDVGTWLLIPFIIVFGVGFGGPMPLLAGLLVDRYGRIRLGTIIGMVAGIMSIGNFFSAPTAGWMHDSFNNYQLAWYIFSGACLLATISILTIPKNQED